MAIHGFALAAAQEIHGRSHSLNFRIVFMKIHTATWFSTNQSSSRFIKLLQFIIFCGGVLTEVGYLVLIPSNRWFLVFVLEKADLNHQANMAEQFELKEYEVLAKYHPNTLFSLSVLNFISSPVATLGNIIVIRALFKATSMPSNIKKLFLSLAISDLAVGFFVQLMAAVIFRIAANDNYDLTQLCSTSLTVCYFSWCFIAWSSFLTLTVIAVDRLLTISLHLRYTELVTPKRIITAIVSVWVTSVGASLVRVYLNRNGRIIMILLGSVGFLVTTVAYMQIYRVRRHHQKQIHGQLQLHSAQATDFIRENKSALNVLWFYLVFIACYLPYLLVAILLITDSTQSSFWVAFYVTDFFVLLNSSLNPLVYCWRYREIRQIIKNIVNKVFHITET